MKEQGQNPTRQQHAAARMGALEQGSWDAKRLNRTIGMEKRKSQSREETITIDLLLAPMLPEELPFSGAQGFACVVYFLKEPFKHLSLTREKMCTAASRTSFSSISGATHRYL